MTIQEIWACAHERDRNRILEQLFLYGRTRLFHHHTTGPLAPATVQGVETGEYEFCMDITDHGGTRNWLTITADGEVVEMRQVSDSELTRFHNHIYERY